MLLLKPCEAYLKAVQPCIRRGGALFLSTSGKHDSHRKNGQAESFHRFLQSFSFAIIDRCAESKAYGGFVPLAGSAFLPRAGVKAALRIASRAELGQKSRAAPWWARDLRQGVRNSVNENLLMLAISSLVSLPLSLALAAAGLPLASAVLLINPPKRVKVFRDKFGQQTATLCLMAGLAALLCLGGAAAFINIKYPAAASFWLSWPLPLAPLAGGAVLAAALAAVYRAVWHNMRDNRAAHASLGMAATLAGWLACYLCVTFFRHFVVSSSEPAANPTFFLPPVNSVAWYIFPAALGLSLTFAGSLGSLYLIHRRDKDDFGRDYYNYSLKLACKWAFFSILPALVFLGGHFARLWPEVRNLPARQTFFWSEAAALAAFAMACLLWILVIRNQNPLRLKLHCVAGYILSLAGLAGVALAYVSHYFG